MLVSPRCFESSHEPWCSFTAASCDVMANVAATQRPGADPSPEAVDFFFELLHKATSALHQCRVLRSAEYFERAASEAVELWGDKAALCVVHANLRQCGLRNDLARATTATGCAAPHWLEAQRLLAECRRILNARLSANTCLAGRCYPVEEDFYVRFNAMLIKVAG